MGPPLWTLAGVAVLLGAFAAAGAVLGAIDVGPPDGPVHATFFVEALPSEPEAYFMLNMSDIEGFPPAIQDAFHDAIASGRGSVTVEETLAVGASDELEEISFGQRGDRTHDFRFEAGYYLHGMISPGQ